MRRRRRREAAQAEAVASGSRKGRVSLTQHELIPGVHLFVSTAWQMASLVVFLGREALLVDPGYFPEEVAGQAGLLASRPETRPALLLTHGDFDHVAGVAQLPPCPLVLGHAALRRRRRDRVARQLAAFDARLYVNRPGPFVFPYPTLPVSEPAVRDLGDERLHLFPAPGHTADSLFALLERRGLFVAGDYLSDLEFPFVEHSTAGYLATLDQAATLLDAFRPRFLIPGHGPVAATPKAMRHRLARDREYLEALSAGVEQAVVEGWGLPETQRRLAALTYDHQPLPSHLRTFHRANVARHYRTLKAEVSP